MANKVNPVEVEKYLKGVDYPATKATLVQHAKGQRADDHIIQALNQLPDQQFHSPADVSKAIGTIDREAKKQGR